MLATIPGLPDDVVGIEATGEVGRDDYEQVLLPAVDAAHAQHEKVSLLYVLGPEFTGYSAGAFWGDAKFGLEHWTGWDRIAIVSDAEWLDRSVKAFAWMIPAGVRVFAVAERDAATAWVTGGS